MNRPSSHFVIVIDIHIIAFPNLSIHFEFFPLILILLSHHFLFIFSCILNYYYLGNNEISIIGPEIYSSLLKLKDLQLFKNKISVIPPEIGLLKGLDYASCIRLV